MTTPDHAVRLPNYRRRPEDSTIDGTLLPPTHHPAVMLEQRLSATTPTSRATCRRGGRRRKPRSCGKCSTHPRSKMRG